MSVIDFLKEKSERLAKSRSDFIEALNPGVRGYVNEALNLAKNSQWFGWMMDQKQISAVGDHTDSEQDWPLSGHSQAQSAFENILSSIDQITYVSDWMLIDQDRINRFADVTNDHQWIHTQPERAATDSPFRTTIAHGFLTLSLIPTLTSAVHPEGDQYSTAKIVVNVGMNRVRYPYPLKVNSRIRASKKVIDVKRVRRGLEVTEEITIEIEGYRRPACIAETVIMLIF